MNIYENIKKNLKESNALPVDYIIDNYDIYTNNGAKIDFPHYSAISETKNKILFKDRFYSSNWEKYLILDKNTNKITYKNKPYSFGYAVPKENSHKEENINESEDGHHMIPYDIQEEVENVVYDDRNLNLRSAQFKGNNFIVNYIDESSDELFDKILKRLDYYFNSYGILCDGIDDDGENVIAHNCYMSDEAYKEYEINNDSYDAEDEDFYMVNNDTDKKVHVYKDGNKWYDTDGNRYRGYLSKSDVKRYFKGNWSELNESENLKESSNVIWSSEVTEDDYDQEELKERYQEYVDSFEPEEDEETGEISEPKEFDDWKYDYIADDSYVQWDMLKDDLESNIYPMIDKQINNDILIVSGNYNSNYPDFRKSGAGGKFLNKAEDLLDWLEKEDRIDILNNDGVVGIAAYDHDGSIGGNLYTVPADDDLLYEIAMKTDYYDEDRSKEDVLGEFSYDVNNGNIDMSDFCVYEDKLVPIKVEW